MENAVKLIVNVRTIGLESQEIAVCYQISPLEKIDCTTFLYQDAQQFFTKKKTYIIQQLRCLLPKQRMIPFVDIELASSGIYIEQKSRKLSPIFQTISWRGTKVNLTEYIKNCLRSGKIIWLYQQDKKNSQNPEYESIFVGLPRVLLMHLEWNQVNERDISSILAFLKQKNRFFSIIRHLLANSSVLDIPLKEEIPKKEEPVRKKEKQWFPYKD